MWVVYRIQYLPLQGKTTDISEQSSSLLISNVLFSVIDVFGLHVAASVWLLLLPDLIPFLLYELFPPFYSTILKPNFDLSFCQSKLFWQIKPLPSHHVLLACKLSLQALQLLHGKNRAHAFWFLTGPVDFIALWDEISCGN